MGGTAALLAALDRQESAEKRARLHGRLTTWGEYQREGYDHPGIDYARPRVVGNAPGSTPPAPEWYLSLCAAISLLPPVDEEAIRRVYIYGQAHPRLPSAFAALLAAEMGD